MDSILENRKQTMKLIGLNLPEWMKPKEACKCGVGIVWGREYDDGSIRYMENEAGNKMTICADCNDEKLSSIYSRKIADKSVVYNNYRNDKKQEVRG